MTQSSQNGTTVYQNDLDLEDSRLDDDKQPNFTLLYEAGLSDLVSRVAGNKLQNKDLTILIIYIIHSDWRTGRCRLTLQKVGEILGRQVKTLYASLKRLKSQNLLVPIRDSRTGESLYIISPFLLKVGSGKARGFLLRTYYDAINSNQPETLHLEDSTPAGDNFEDPDWNDQF